MGPIVAAGEKGASFVQMGKRNRGAQILSMQKKMVSDRYSNSDSRISIFKINFFEPVRPRKRFQIQVFGVAIDSVYFSSKSEPSSRCFGLLKIFVLFEYLGLKKSMTKLSNGV